MFAFDLLTRNRLKHCFYVRIHNFCCCHIGYGIYIYIQFAQYSLIIKHIHIHIHCLTHTKHRNINKNIYESSHSLQSILVINYPHKWQLGICRIRLNDSHHNHTDCRAKRQSNTEECGHHGRCHFPFTCGHRFRCPDHRDVGQIAVAERKRGHQHDERVVGVNERRQRVTWIGVAQQQCRHEGKPQNGQCKDDGGSIVRLTEEWLVELIMIVVIFWNRILTRQTTLRIHILCSIYCVRYSVHCTNVHCK